MQINLDPQFGFLKGGKFNQKDALIDAGVKAAVCFKETKEKEVFSPNSIRDTEANSQLILRGLNTIYSGHTTPTEHPSVGLEITNIPKVLCMVLNNEHQYTACERSLRYTPIESNEIISDLEVKNYNKWLKIFEYIIEKEYGDFYRKVNGTEAKTKKAIKKLAQENARYQVSIFMPTTLTYSAPWIQINKIASYMEKVIEGPFNNLENMLIPYFKEFIATLKYLKVLITKEDVLKLCDEDMFNRLCKNHPEIKNYKDNNSLLYENNKNIDLSFFANRNPFTGINLPNEFGVNVSINHKESFACLAQEQRHRTIDCEMEIPSGFEAFIPPIIDNNLYLCSQWLNDMISVKNKFPQGQIVIVNTSATLSNLIDYVSKERCCEHAQLEIEQKYINEIIPEIYSNLVLNRQYKLAEELKPYVGKLRCAYPTYNCPSKCGHPRLTRRI